MASQCKMYSNYYYNIQHCKSTWKELDSGWDLVNFGLISEVLALFWGISLKLFLLTVTLRWLVLPSGCNESSSVFSSDLCGLNVEFVGALVVFEFSVITNSIMEVFQNNLDRMSHSRIPLWFWTKHLWDSSRLSSGSVPESSFVTELRTSVSTEAVIVMSEPRSEVELWFAEHWTLCSADKAFWFDALLRKSL